MGDTDDWGGRREFLRATGAAGAAAALPVSVTADEADEPERPRIAVVGLSDPAAVETIDADLPAAVEVLDRSAALQYVRVALPRGDGAYDRLRVESRVATLDPVKYVEYDEPMPVLATAGDPEPVTPSDPEFSDQYAPQEVKAPSAWAVLEAVDDRRIGEEEVVVGVVDTGTEYDHPDLQAAFGDDLGHDCVDRWFWASPDDDPAPGAPSKEYHGTHVSGIVGATRDNATGVSGVSDATLRSYRAISEDGLGRPTDVANAVRKAADDGADVINMSLGFVVPTFVVKDAVAYAVEEGTLPVAAAGNVGDAPPSLPGPLKEAWRSVDSETHVWYPGAYDDCVCVSALDPWDTLADYSKYGPEVDVTAPGTSVLSTMPQGHPSGDYAELSGTSMAAPVVAGVAAMIRRRFPDMGVEAVRQRLADTADDVGLSEQKQGAGRVNALRAVSSGTVESDAADVVTTHYDGELGRGGEWTDTHEVRTVDPRRVTVQLRGPDDADLDLYVTTDGSEPDETDFDHRAWTVGSEEEIEITDASGLSELGLLVDAFSDDGQFRVTVVEQPRSTATAPALDLDAATSPGSHVFAADLPDAEAAPTWEIDGRSREGRVVTADLSSGEHRVAVDIDGQRRSGTVAVAPEARAGHRRRVETYEGSVGEAARFVHEPAADADRVTVRVEALDGPADLDLFAAREGRATPERHDAAGTTVFGRERVSVADPEGSLDLLVRRVAGDSGRARVVVEELV